MFCTKFHAVTKRSQMHPNTTKHIETLLYGPMGWIGCVRCAKSRCDFVAQTFALIASIHPVLHRVSCSYVPNAPKHYETHQKHEFRVQWGGLGVFIMKNFDATLWHKLLQQFGLFSPSFVTQPNVPKCTKIVRNTPNT